MNVTESATVETKWTKPGGAPLKYPIFKADFHALDIGTEYDLMPNDAERVLQSVLETMAENYDEMISKAVHDLFPDYAK